MLRSAQEIIGYQLYAGKEEVGRCEDLLFDDRTWTIRHMVADTGGWLVGHLVLISPVMIKSPEWGSRQILLNITKEQVADCPSPSADEPVSREHEKRISQHYGYPYYWGGAGLWGPGPYPADLFLPSDPAPEGSEENPEAPGKTNHLRSFNEVKGYDIKSPDGNIGHVEDFIMDDETWALRYVIVDTRNWLPGGKKVMLSLNWASRVDWAESAFEMDLSKEQIENGPEFDPSEPINVEVETRLYDYYGRPYQQAIDKRLQQTIGHPFI